MRLTLLILTICLALFSCKKHVAAINPLAFWTCTITENDSTLIAQKLAGSWKWTKQFCSSQITPANKSVTVIFNSNAGFTITEDSVITTQGNWKLQNAGPNQWQLSLDSSSNYLRGFISFCNNEVVFADIYFDGCNNYFDKIN